MRKEGIDLDLIKEMCQTLDKVRAQSPLIHHITNYVTVNDCANIVLAIGASPIMADDIDEVEDITSISSALVLNIGTLNKRTIQSMIKAGKKANMLGIPVIFDPVGAGASRLRNETTQRIMEEVKIAVLRGNMSEVRFVAGLKATTKGVDASEIDKNMTLISAAEIGKKVAEDSNCIVAVTGATDIVTDGRRAVFINNGTEHLSNVTGTGCMCTSLVGSFCGACEIDDLFSACIGGICAMGICGELAYESAGKCGYGGFHMAIIDAASKLTSETMVRRAKINEA
ncbi:MAG TPA: hydroxyethylthiazole kinase [Bacillota bacterium]|nr:hydroxyethylthiazole kinase [Bacillota bacterium]